MSLKKYRVLRFLSLLLFFSNSLHAQVGVGTATPQAFFNVAEGKDVLFGNDVTSSGTKLSWIPSKAAFRVGSVTATLWNPSNVGDHSFAFGQDGEATGVYSVSMGLENQASGKGAMAFGLNNKATLEGSVAMGKGNIATRPSAVAMGYNSSAYGDYAIALGNNAQAAGNNSVSLGETAMSIGNNSIAIGRYTYATGDYSVALGSNVYTNLKKGSFAFGDATQVANGDWLKNDLDNQMVMRFQNGYKLFTNYQATIGVLLEHGDNSWSVISDSTRKENFRAVDGEVFLKKISAMRLGSWNYKEQDAKIFRHYGPMAQDFFAAFGHDALGTIGQDKKINQSDFDGVNLIAIQALIKEVNQLKEELAAIKDEKSNTSARIDRIEIMLRERTSDAALTSQH